VSAADFAAAYNPSYAGQQTQHAGYFKCSSNGAQSRPSPYARPGESSFYGQHGCLNFPSAAGSGQREAPAAGINAYDAYSPTATFPR